MQILKRILTALSTAALVVLAILYAPKGAFIPVVGILCALAEFEYLQLVARRLSPLSPRGLAVLLPGAALIALALAALPFIAFRHDSKMLLYVIAIVKFSDMGGFAIGMLWGRHKLCPSISPKKSWEGLGGSVLASVLMSVAFVPVTHFGFPKAALLGVLAALVGTFGDLVESKFKRWAGVKDSATFMPAGLGGFLDMIDSLLFAPILILLFL